MNTIGVFLSNSYTVKVFFGLMYLEGWGILKYATL